jgi:hypothetical protein
MAKERTRGDSQGYFKEFLLANPTVVLSLLYLYVTGVGMLYSAVLYGRFGINVFDYSEIGDFLLAAFKNPVAFLSGGLLAAVGFALLYYRASAVSRRLREVDSIIQEGIQELEELDRIQERVQELVELEQRELTKAMYQRERLRHLVQQQSQMQRRLRLLSVISAIVMPLTIVFSSFVLPYYSAGKTASSIKAGEYPSVDVRYRSFKGSAGQVTVPGLGLIGATQKAAFFYDVDHKHTLVVPQSQIVSIEVPEQD